MSSANPDPVNSDRGRRSRQRGLSIERKVRDILARLMSTATERHPSTGYEQADVSTDYGQCPLCGTPDAVALAVEVKSFIRGTPAWLNKAFVQAARGALQMDKTGVVVASFKDKNVRRYYVMFEVIDPEKGTGPEGPD